MNSVLSMEFMQNALMAGVLASLACGIIGSLVVVNRQVFMAGGVAHTAYGGVGLAFFLGLPVLPCAVGFTVLAALIMALASFGRSERSDGIIGIMWAAGMAFGIILLDLTPGYNVDLMSYLFGSLLAVPASDIWIMLLLDLFILAVVLFWYKDFLSLSFDMEFARSTGVPVRMLYVLMQVMTAVTVVMVIQVAGLILVIALLTIPPMLAELFTNSLWKTMVLATLASLFFCLCGLAVSYHLDLTSGASIIAVATAGYIVAWGCKTLWRRT
ncbi:zinc transport system permease protein [Desulfomicrobium macestii]|uniref:Zinc transport system permease protein n=1 Tax=Desulfomicrobium macestii TaxID=90731 RepID=A0ABR9GYH5_9BACT|nr:iron chelate uptake ABC transporter family permease subunit [Desulfomicrobium macestii]MBE1423498.1 zinc transport system permease protein [Desulfomicrobium macestii]